MTCSRPPGWCLAGQVSNQCPALSSLSMNGAARLTLYDPERSSPHAPGPEGLILGTPPFPSHEGPLTPASSSSSSSRRVSGVNLEAIWEAMSAWTCGASQRQGRLRGVGPIPGPAPIPFPALPRHLLPGSSLCFVFPKTASLSRHRLAQPPLPSPQPPPGPGLRPSVPSWGSRFSQTMRPEAGGGGRRGGPEGAAQQGKSRGRQTSLEEPGL